MRVDLNTRVDLNVRVDRNVRVELNVGMLAEQRPSNPPLQSRCVFWHQRGCRKRTAVMTERRKRRRVTRKWRRRKSQRPLRRCVIWGRVCRTAQYPGTEPGSCRHHGPYELSVLFLLLLLLLA